MGLKDVERDSFGLELGSTAGFWKRDNKLPEILTGWDFLRSRAAQRRERDGFMDLEQCGRNLTPTLK
jgi:hypothetical protein